MKFSALFTTLLESRSLSIRVESQRAHENLRARLCRAFSDHKDALQLLDPSDPDLDLAVRAVFDHASGISTFSLGERRGGAGVEVKDYEVVSVGKADA